MWGERMSKMRIYEYAREKNVSSKEVIDELLKMDIEVASHMSSINLEEQLKLDDIFNGKGTGEKAKTKTKQTNQKQKPTTKKEKEKAKPKQQTDKKVKQQTAKKQPKKKKKQQAKQRDNKQSTVGQSETPTHLVYSGTLTVSELAERLKKDVSEIIKKLLFLGVMATKNQDLDDDAIELICDDYGITVEKEVVLEDTDFEKYRKKDAERDLVERPAVVTIMGHVDHGKTTLLDSIRHTKVTEGEAGGITQHIGAYQIERDDKKITFLDTPGHEAFTSMRSRGAQVTDIAILVVAADDGVMPQTVEALNHAKAAEVPIIVAVNKMDKEHANPDRVMQELTEHELIPEDWGGETIFVPISALRGDGIDELLEMILLVAEMEELKANPDKEAFGTVIDARLDRGRGVVATLLR